MGRGLKKNSAHLKRLSGSDRRRAIVYWSVGTAACILLYVSLSGMLLFNARHDLVNGQNHLTSAYSLSVDGNLKDARWQFKKAENDLAAAKSSLDSSIILPMQLIPIVNTNLKAVRDLTEAGLHIAGAGSLITATALGESQVNPRVNPKAGLETPLIRDGRINLDMLNSMKTDIARISHHIKSANRAYNDMPKTMLLPVLSAASEKFGEKISKLKSASEMLDNVLAIMPGLLGEKSKRSYFLAIQNNAELRATGGIIGNYGIITVDNGKISLDEFDEIHVLQKDNLKAVEMPQEYMLRYGRYNANGLWLNTNMSPDFPTSGHIVSELYANSTGKKVDGIISIDPVALKYVLEALGPIEIVGANNQVYKIDSNNVIDETLVKAYSQYAERKERKGFLSDVAKGVWARMLSGDFDMVGVLKQIGLSLDEKHMAVYSKYTKEQQLIERLGYSGSIKKTTGDYFQAVLQNHGANKLDIYTYQDIDYHVSLGKDGSAEVTATISIENKAPASELPDYVAGETNVVPRGYANIWLSVYVPKSTQLQSAVENNKDLQVEIGKERDKTVYSQYIKIKPGSKTTVKFIYRIPDVIRDGDKGAEYVFDAQAQPVLNPPSFVFTLDAPDGFISVPEDCKREGRKRNKAVYRTWLTRDTELRFGLAEKTN